VIEIGTKEKTHTVQRYDFAMKTRRFPRKIEKVESFGA
jgi:hypothetical protein